MFRCGDAERHSYDQWDLLRISWLLPASAADVNLASGKGSPAIHYKKTVDRNLPENASMKKTKRLRSP